MTQPIMPNAPLDPPIPLGDIGAGTTVVIILGALLFGAAAAVVAVQEWIDMVTAVHDRIIARRAVTTRPVATLSEDEPDNLTAHLVLLDGEARDGD